jgi:hypothetical protein
MSKDTTFRKNDFDKYDVQAREEAKILISDVSPHCLVTDNPQTYDCDLIIKNTDTDAFSFLEVEYKNFGRLDIIEREGLHIASRKMKYYADTTRTVNHVTFLKGYTKCILFGGVVLRECGIVSKPCRRGADSYNNSQFIEVYPSQGTVFEKINGVWKYSPNLL